MSVAANSAEKRQIPDDALDSLPDADLMEAWTRDQHAKSLATLVNRYSVMVLSVCRRRCRSEADADDAFQTTFLYLARNCGKIRQPERLPGWLHRVAQRSAVATLKSTPCETLPMIEPPADPDDPLDRLTQRHEAIVLDEELADLPEQYRSAIVMHLYEGRPIGKLAEHFGTTTGSIRGRLQRGKKLLGQRLRRRGVVPVLAYAAASAWTAPEIQAAQAGSAFADATADGDLPDPPIDTSLLDSLLVQGTRFMPSLYTATGVLGTSALIGLIMLANGTHGQTPSQKREVTLPSSIPSTVAQFGGNPIRQTPESKANQGGVSDGKGKANDANPNDGLVWTNTAVVPEPSSEIAKSLLEKLDKNSDFQISTPLNDFAQSLSDSLGLPVLMDERGIAFAKQDLASSKIEYADSDVPLRTALRNMLGPLGLRAVVEDDGLVITANPSSLVHRGIGASRWINIEQDAAEKIAAAIEQESQVEFIDLPLNEAVATLSRQHDVPMLVDDLALEEIGLSHEQPVSLVLAKQKLKNVLQLMLRDFQLTYTIRGETLVITTLEAAESELLNRVYWLEGTGFAKGDFQSIIELIQTSITPDTWEALGGPSTIAPVTSSRPAILVSCSYPIHANIESLLHALRETHFGREPELEAVQVPAGTDRNGATSEFGGGGFGGGGAF